MKESEKRGFILDRLFQIVCILILALTSQKARAEFKLTVLQTSDMHSHFTDRDSEFGMGGLARVAAKAAEIRSHQRNVLFLDAGDFSEGTIFFTLGSGETGDRLIEKMGYDALVLGNHDWLIGPHELYQTLTRAGFNVPILSANLDMNNLTKETPLDRYIKPYIIKEMDGVKIGILGLSTFQFIYDSFFEPVRILEPARIAKQYVKQLREVEHCQIVIVLSHLGFNADRKIARSVPGINLIVGGHTHLLLEDMFYEKGVPISHVGKWGQYLGEIDLTFAKGKTKVENRRLYQIDGRVSEEPVIKGMIDGAIRQVEARFGKIFDDHVIRSEVDLPFQDKVSESIAGDWATDAMRDITHTDLAVENPTYTSRDIFRGVTDTVDMFNVFPHVFNPETGKTWTVKFFELSGLYTQLLMSTIYRSGLNLRISNARVVIDQTRLVDQIQSVEIGGQPLDPKKNYWIAGTDGIIAVFDFLKSYGINISPRQIKDTGKEAWQVEVDYFKKLSPITPDKVKWEGRVRTLQPDLMVRPEEFQTKHMSAGRLDLTLVVRNNGINPSNPTKLFLGAANLAGDTLDRRVNILSNQSSVPIGKLEGGQSVTIRVPWDVSHRSPGRYAVVAEVEKVDGELEVFNNKLYTYIDVP